VTEIERRATFLVHLLPREDGVHHIQVIREPDADEKQAIETAQQVVLGMSRAEAFNRCVELYALVQERIGDVAAAEAPARDQIERLHAAFASFAVALERLAADLSERVGEHEAFGTAAQAARRSRPWTDVAAVGDPSAGSFQRSRADGDLVWQRCESGEVLSLAGLAFVATQIAEQLLAEAFRTLGDEITDAATRLRRLSVEAPEGFPGLVELPVVDGDPVLLDTFTPQALAIDRVSEVLRAVRIARTLETALQREYAAEPEPAVEPEPTSQPVEPEGPVEMSALFRLAGTLATDLEQAWSGALDEARLQPALATQIATTVSLLKVLQRQLASDREPIMEWPLSLQSVLEIETERSHATDRLARLDAITRVGRNLAALDTQTSVKISFGDGGAKDRVERFWDAGAFGLLKNQLLLLERLDPDSDPRSDGYQRLQLGVSALMHGDPEAALTHAVLAAATILDVPLTELPATAAERTLDAPERQPFTQRTFERAIAVVQATADGRPNAGAALFLAPTTLRATEALLHGPLPARNLSGIDIADLVDADNPLDPLGDA